MSETAIHIAVAEHLRLRAPAGMVWWHTPNEGARTPSEAARLKAMGVKAGIPDLMLVHGGKLYALELKAERGVISKNQQAMLSALSTAGAVVAVAFGLSKALATLEQWAR